MATTRSVDEIPSFEPQIKEQSMFPSSVFILVFLSCLSGCAAPKVDTSTSKTEQIKQEPTSQSASANSVESRISETKGRLQQSNAGKTVWASIEASGGLTSWFRDPIGFRFRYLPLARPGVDTYQIVDTFAARARHAVVVDSGFDFTDEYPQFGWDGQKAWSRSPIGKEANDGIPKSPRFWALTPYYFVGMPFVLGDPGVVLTAETDAEIEGVSCDVVRVTFEASVGDAPGDYYVVYFDKRTKRVKALRYVVSYVGFFPDGGHTPEKLMVYEGMLETVEGTKVAERYPTYKWVDSQKGDKVTDILVSDLKFEKTLNANFFDVPADAKIHEGY